jgi:hypothetical protein
MNSTFPTEVESQRVLLAAMALQGIIAKGVNIGEDGAIHQQVATAVRYADALLAKLAAPHAG